MVTKSKPTAEQGRGQRASSPCRRFFCGWNTPLLETATHWLIENREHWQPCDEELDAMPLFAGQSDGDSSGSQETEPTETSDSPIDLSTVDVILPSSRAISRVREKLAAAAQATGQEYRPPRFHLVGRLPSLLYRRPAEWASDLEQSLAWARVLRDSDPAALQSLVPTLPEADASTGWLDLASTAGHLWKKISAENWTFSDILAHAESDAERRRWNFLVDLHRRYLSELNAAERCDPHAAALDAIASGRCRALRPIVLVGASDLPEMAKAMLADLDVSVSALIAAPEQMADRFDAVGCLLPGAWRNHLLPLDDEQLIPADTVEDQAQCVCENLADLGESYSVDAITIGVTDESQIEPIENQCRLYRVDTYRHLGWTLAETSLGRLIELLITYQQRRHWRSLAALVRHADVYRMLDRHFHDLQATSKSSSHAADTPGNDHPRKPVPWLTRLDQLMAEAFPRSIDQPLPADREETETANQIHDFLEQWLAPLQHKRQNLRAWSQAFAQILSRVYREDQTNGASNPNRANSSESVGRSEHAVVAALETLEHFQGLSTALDTPMDSHSAMELLAARLVDVSLPDTPASQKIEILGWLDLALDDAPALTVCGLNHPFVPEAAASDPFLPTSLTRRLSHRLNERRYARDVHTMQQLLGTRPSVRFIIGTHSADGSPTPPSRLLAASSADDAARRVCRLLTEQRPKVEIISPGRETKKTIETPATRTESDNAKVDYFRPPPPEPGRTVSTLSVTAFSAYLACPYRFYLRHVLRLRPLDDASLELAANQFGDLIHGALEYFGESDAKDESDPVQIEKQLIAQLHRFAAERYGENTASTVQLQVRQAERRLKTVALRQAERREQGWIIHAVEASVDELGFDQETQKPKEPTGIWIDGEFTGLRGRFDRIDYHPGTDRWAILDYKTHGHLPEKKHLKKLADGSVHWVDLQLPLYRRFIPHLGIPAGPASVELGYFNVAEKDTETKINIAEFTESQFADADELIHHCVRQIRAGHFEPSESGVQFDDYEMMFNEATTTIPEDDESESENNFREVSP